MAIETLPETVTITLSRAMFEESIWGFIRGIASSSDGARSTGAALMRALETGKPLSEELVARLISYAINTGKYDLVSSIARACRASQKLTDEERKAMKPIHSI